MKKVIVLFSFISLILVNVSSQNFETQVKSQRESFDEFRKKTQSGYNAFKNTTEQEFKNFRDSINAEFAKFMERTWTKSSTKPAIKAPDTPLPPVIATPDKEKRPHFEPKPQNEVSKPIAKPEYRKSDTPIATLTPLPQKSSTKPAVTPKPIQEKAPAVKNFNFEFYGTPCNVTLYNPQIEAFRNF